MKKVVRMLGLCALVALAFTSCNKKDDTNKVTFKATITQPVADGRTGIDTNDNLFWTAGDAIQVFDENRNTTDPFVATLTANPKEATFTGDGAFLAKLNEAGKYTAFYPVATYDDNTVTMDTIPYSQTYVPRADGRIATNLFPMHATNNDEGNFVFSSDAGVLRISLFCSDQASPFNVDRIEIISASQNDVVNGTYVYDIVTRSKNVVAPAENANKVVLGCGGEMLPPNANWSVDFDIVVLGGVFADGFTMNVVRDNGQVFTKTALAGDNTTIVNAGCVRAMTAVDVATSN